MQRTIHYNQIELIPESNGRFNNWKSIDIIKYIKKLQEKHRVISINSEKDTQNQTISNTDSKQHGNYLKLIKATY